MSISGCWVFALFLGAMGCAPGAGLRAEAPGGGGTPATEEYEKSRCCELEDPTFHHLKAMSATEVDIRYRFRVGSEPDVLQAGRPAKIDVFIEGTGGGASGDLGTLPERRPNFLLLSGNLAEMHHFHPEDLGNWKEAALFEGRFTLPVTFRLGGTHWLIVDFLDKGVIVSKALRLEVEGPAQEPLVWDLTRTRRGEGMRAVFETVPAAPRAGSLMNGTVVLAQEDGRPVTDLERYGDALAHVVLVPRGDASLARHLHGGGQEHSHFRLQKIVPGYRGPKLYFNDSLRFEGKHRVLAQFRRAGEARTLAFDFETGAREAGTP
jgi:hypothetical protein